MKTEAQREAQRDADIAAERRLAECYRICREQTQMTLTEAKHIADRIGKGYPATATEINAAVKLLQATNRGSKTQKAWDRLDRRLKALQNANKL